MITKDQAALTVYRKIAEICDNNMGRATITFTHKEFREIGFQLDDLLRALPESKEN